MPIQFSASWAAWAAWPHKKCRPPGATGGGFKSNHTGNMHLTIREVKLSYRTKSRVESTALDTSRKRAAYLKGALDGEFIEQEPVAALAWKS